MLAFNYKLFLLFPLLATVSKGVHCESFEDVMYHNKTSAVVSATGFVESITIPSGKNRHYRFERYENATGTVTPVGTDGPGKIRHLGFNKTLTLTIPGAGKNWTGFKTIVNFTDMMDYFADGGVGVVIDLENHSTLTASDMSDWNFTSYKASPAKLYKVAVAVQHEVEMDITISHANFLSISMRDYKERDSNTVWTATDDGLIGMSNFVNSKNDVTGKIKQSNTCFNYKMSRAYTSSPTPSPTASGATARGSGVLAGMLTLLAAACLAVQGPRY